jgi:predicted 3-demethylubiquinone-9 3-methyltransferase (glyoxalase superfamily)
MAQKITSMLWFDGQAEQAAKFYASVFKKARVGKPMKGPDGKVLVMPIEINGVEFSLLNGGPEFKFNESVSFVIHCKDQAEVDYYWDKLTSGGGEESMCGWLKDRYGLSWQVVPDELFALMRGPKADKVMQAFMKMRKFDIAALERAAA